MADLATAPAAAGLPAVGRRSGHREPRSGVASHLLGGLGPGVSVLYLSFMVLLPVAALISTSATSQFWSDITAPLAERALRFTIEIALITAVIDVIAGIALAWVLVRDDFPGRSVVNALIDLPFALPTIVAGLILLTLYGGNSPVGIDLVGTRWAVLAALLFVTLPFVARAIQPVLLTLDRDVEDAAACLGASQWTTFRRVTLPALLPAAFTGGSLAFARALGEFGSVVLIAATLHAQVASIYIYGQVESGNVPAAAAVSVTLLALAVVVLLLLSFASRRWAARRD